MYQPKELTSLFLNELFTDMYEAILPELAKMSKKNNPGTIENFYLLLGQMMINK
jgi:hypothetical protein